MASLKEKIQQAENVYKDTLKRLQTLEEKLKAKKFPESQGDLLETELKEIRKLLADHETHIRHLKTHNRMLFVLMVVFMGVCCAVYMIYVLVFGPPTQDNDNTEAIIENYVGFS